MFEVGKKYVPKDIPSGIPVTCVYVSDLSGMHNTTGIVVFKHNTGSEFSIPIGHAFRYKEYKKPRTFKRYMVVYEWNENSVPTFFLEGHHELEKARKGDKLYGIYKVLDIVEINWIEKNV